MRDKLVSWQWQFYRDNHQDRRNLVVHVITVPLFMLGTISVVATPWLGVFGGIGGLLAMFAAIGAQGRTHKSEANAPVPFAGFSDVVTRIFVEQWITFPRFVLSGGIAKAWKQTPSR